MNETETETSLLDIIQFLRSSWKKLTIAVVVGTFLGLGNWFFLAPYTASYILLNNTSSYGIDLIAFKFLQRNLPNLAAQLVKEGKVPEGQSMLYQTLASDQWWQKNVTPNYALSKADMKDLMGASKEFDGAITSISSFVINAEAPTLERANNVASGASQFFRSGGAYIQISSMLNTYEVESISAAVEIQKKITETKTEINYQEQRVKYLEGQRKRYPSKSYDSMQMGDTKKSTIKFLPIEYQISAAYDDINQSKELVIRLEHRLAKLASIKLFLDEGLPISQKIYDGLLLSEELLAIEAKLRGKFIGGSGEIEALDQVRQELVVIQTRFTKAIQVSASFASNSRKGMIKSTAGGLIGGFFLALILLLCQRVWSKIKDDLAKLKSE